VNDLLKTIHLAATDSHFRVQLQADPRVAIASLGLTLDDEELAVLGEMRLLFAHCPATWLSGQGYGDPMRNWIGGRSFARAALA
jgi:hypothetical protein